MDNYQHHSQAHQHQHVDPAQNLHLHHQHTSQEPYSQPSGVQWSYAAAENQLEGIRAARNAVATAGAVGGGTFPDTDGIMTRHRAAMAARNSSAYAAPAQRSPSDGPLNNMVALTTPLHPPSSAAFPSLAQPSTYPLPPTPTTTSSSNFSFASHRSASPTNSVASTTMTSLSAFAAAPPSASTTSSPRDSPPPASWHTTPSSTASTPARGGSTGAARRKTKLINETRREICLYAEQFPSARQEDIAAFYNIERSTVSKILKQKEKWKAIVPGGATAKVAKHRPSKFPEIESRLSAWARDCTRTHVILTDQVIRDKAREVAKELGYTEEKFKASSGWVEKFKERNSIRKGQVQTLLAAAAAAAVAVASLDDEVASLAGSLATSGESGSLLGDGDSLMGESMIDEDEPVTPAPLPIVQDDMTMHICLPQSGTPGTAAAAGAYGQPPPPPPHTPQPDSGSQVELRTASAGAGIASPVPTAERQPTLPTAAYNVSPSPASYFENRHRARAPSALRRSDTAPTCTPASPTAGSTLVSALDQGPRQPGPRPPHQRLPSNSSLVPPSTPQPLPRASSTPSYALAAYDAASAAAQHPALYAQTAHAASGELSAHHEMQLFSPSAAPLLVPGDDQQQNTQGRPATPSEQAHAAQAFARLAHAESPVQLQAQHQAPSQAHYGAQQPPSSGPSRSSMSAYAHDTGNPYPLHRYRSTPSYPTSPVIESTPSTAYLTPAPAAPSVSMHETYTALGTVMRFLEAQPSGFASPADLMVVGQLRGRVEQMVREHEGRA